MRILMLMLFFAVAGLSLPARAADPIQGDWPPIPGNQGMAWFLDSWEPKFSHNWHAVGSYTYLRSGVIAYEKGSPDDRYRVVEERESYVILLVKNVHSDGRWHYSFEHLHPAPLTPEQKSAGVPLRAMLGYCSTDHNLDETGPDLMALPQAELQALWAVSFCNPLVGRNRATAKYPWGTGWSREDMERMSDYGRVEAAKGWARKQGISPEEVDWPHLPGRR